MFLNIGVLFQPQFLQEFSQKDRARHRERRFMEYDSKHDIQLPRAPAFQCKKSTEVKQIVNRLMMAPKERFNFVHTPNKSIYNDWKTAHEEKIQRLRETVHMFGGPNRHQRKNKIAEEEDKHRVTEKGHRKKKKPKMDNTPDIGKVNTLPEIAETEN